MSEKKYYHRVPGARFILPDGRDLIFSAQNGEFRTTDPLAISELDKVANLPTSMIYTQKEVIGIEEVAVAKEVMTEATSAFDADNKIPAGTATIAMAQPANPKPVLAADPGLAEKLAAAKAAIASSTNGEKANPEGPKK